MLILDKALDKINIDLILFGKSIVRQEMDELRDGYVMNYTGRLKDVGIDLEPTINGVVIEFEFEPYGLKINEGYSAEDARERAEKFGAKSYYDDLYQWYRKKKGLDGKSAKKAAYFTFKNHLEQGYKSKRSANGFGFIDHLQLSVAKIDEKNIATDELFYAFIRQVNALYSLDLYII